MLKRWKIFNVVFPPHYQKIRKWDSLNCTSNQLPLYLVCREFRRVPKKDQYLPKFTEKKLNGNGEYVSSSPTCSESSFMGQESPKPSPAVPSTANAADSSPSPVTARVLSMRGLPKKRVQRWFLPGMTEEPKEANIKEKVQKSKEADRSTKEEKASQSSSTTSPRREKNKDICNEGETNGGDGKPEEIEQNDDKGVQGESELVVGAVKMPVALLRYVVERNNEVKAYLMKALGADFAKAGLHTDGVRTSFSVVNYQNIKQLTGLKRVPSKLLVSCLIAPDRSFDWIDISAHPTASLTEYKESVCEILLGLGMHQMMVEDSTQPMLLPQVTVTKTIRAILLRYAVNPPFGKQLQMDSVQDLTNRFTIFLTQNRIITVHRNQCSFVEELRVEWLELFAERTITTPRAVLHYLTKEAIHTFSVAISKCIVEFDQYEAGLFSSSRNRSHLARQIYHIKRRASVYGRTLTLTQDAYSHICSALKVFSSDVSFQEIQHDLAHVQSLAEELNSNADSVLQLLFQLSSYQVNELMRVLTLFSAFFIPLSFIASCFGMNFEGLPLINDPYGEVYCGILMLVVAFSIFVWFKKKMFI